MPALTLHLLPEIFLQLQSKTPLSSAEALGHLLDVVGADSGLGKLAQQGDQRGHRTLELIRLAEIAPFQDLFDLPVKPEGRLIQQSAVITGPVLLEKFIRVLARRQVKNPQLQLTLESQLLHLTDRSVGGAHAGAIGVEIQNDAFAITAATELGDLLTAEGRSQ